MSHERMIGLVTAVSVVGVVLYLVVRNERIADARLVELLRIILSVAMGVLGATIPGFLHIDYKAKGLAVRAAGALALVALTYFYTPKVGLVSELKPASVSVDTPTRVDLRTSAGGLRDEEARKNGRLAITLDMAYRNQAQPAASATLKHTDVEFELGGKPYRLPWLYFVNLHEEQHGKWLSIEGSATSQTVVQGSTLTKEIMHEAKGILWSDFIREWAAAGPDAITFTISSAIDTDVFRTRCTVDARQMWRHVESLMRAQGGEPPGRVTMCCRERPPETTVGECQA